MISGFIFKSLYENQVLIVKAFLQYLGVQVNLSTVDDTLHNHPDYPSFLSITDSLQKWNVESLAIKTNVDKLDEIPLPFITSFKQGFFVTVIGVANDSVEMINQNGVKKVLERGWFIKQWTETIVIAEANDKPGEPDYQKQQYQTIAKSVAYSILPITCLASIILPLINGTNGLVPTAYLLLKLFGLTVSLLLLWYDIDKGNPLLKQICSGIQKANCNAVLNTKAASLFGVLTWSEVGFIYFSGSLLFASFAGIKEIIPVLSSLSFLAFPYIFFSIYYQWRIAKQWCVLCLLVQSVLLLETVLVLTGTQNSVEAAITAFNNHWVAAVISLAIPIICWFLVKPVLKKLQNAKYEKRSYLQLKYNDQVFWSLLQKQKSIVEHSTEGLGITIGNPSARHTIVKVCNPYCGPCANAHPELEKIIAQNPNINAQIIFSVSDKEDGYKVKPVKHLLAIAEKGNEQLTHKALDDWYLAPKKDYDSFANKYPMNGELKMQTAKIEKMSSWCNEVGIQYKIGRAHV